MIFQQRLSCAVGSLTVANPANAGLEPGTAGDYKDWQRQCSWMAGRPAGTGGITTSWPHTKMNRKTVVCLLVVVIAVVVLAALNLVERSRMRSRIAEFDTCDHYALLAACRDMVTHRDDYRTNKSYLYSASDPGSVYLTPKAAPFDDAVPKVVRDLRPFYIFIKKDCVIITGHYSGLTCGTRIGIVGFAEGASQYGTRKYIDGLWYWNGHSNTRNGQPTGPRAGVPAAHDP